MYCGSVTHALYSCNHVYVLYCSNTQLQRGIFFSSCVTFTVALTQTFNSRSLLLNNWQLGALLKRTSSVGVEGIESVSLSFFPADLGLINYSPLVTCSSKLYGVNALLETHNICCRVEQQGSSTFSMTSVWMFNMVTC